MTSPFDAIRAIDFVDVGCSGELDARWKPLFPVLHYTGFDPNAAECERLNSAAHSYASCRYLPWAIAGEAGAQTLYTTESIYCYSLLRPNHAWLDRFTFGHLFRETGTQTVQCTTLDELARSDGLRADVLKLDTQGLELPILRAGTALTAHVFCIETETGFVQNYIGETTYADVDAYLRGLGFLLFDMNMDHRISRRNALAKSGRHQPLWCEAVWMFDIIGRGRVPTREQALRSLVICRALQFHDYGCELAVYYRERQLIDDETFAFLQCPENWTG